MRILLSVLVLCFAPALVAQPAPFADVTSNLGIAHTYTGDSHGGGASFADYDLDGRDDLSLVSGDGEIVAFYRNGGQSYAHDALPMGALDPTETLVVLWADYDNDADQDLFVGYTNRPNQLYRNDDGTFVEVSAAAGLLQTEHTNNTHKTMTAGWADYDHDGWLDLFIGNWGSEALGGTGNELYRNNGDGTFDEVSIEAGVNTAKEPLATAFFDYDLDGWTDLYLANDKQLGNQLYRNNGDGTFQNVSAASGADLAFDAMGLAVGDIDLDGDFDVYVSNSQAGNGLLRNNGDGTFDEIADEVGVGVYKVCWGVNFMDVDNDGDLDAYSAVSFAGDGRNELFQNLGDGTFQPYPGFVGSDATSYGTALGDFDADGYPDLAVIHTNSPMTLWHNQGGTNHWLRLHLVGTESNRDALGSIIEIWTGGAKQLRTVQGSSSYKGQDSRTQLVGLGSAAQVDSVVVRWPSGAVDVHYDLEADDTYTLVEGQVGSTDAEATPAVADLALGGYPNPFAGQTTITWTAPAAVTGRSVAVYDLLGRRVQSWSLADGQAAGEIVWDGRDERGHRLAAGIYLYRLTAGTASRTTRSVVIR